MLTKESYRRYKRAVEAREDLTLSFRHLFVGDGEEYRVFEHPNRGTENFGVLSRPATKKFWSLIDLAEEDEDPEDLEKAADLLYPFIGASDLFTQDQEAWEFVVLSGDYEEFLELYESLE